MEPHPKEKLSVHVSHWAEETRETALGYRDMRNIVFAGVVGFTGFLNSRESINSLPPAEQLKFNVAGIGLAVLSAAGMEWGKRKRQKKAKTWDSLSEELSGHGS